MAALLLCGCMVTPTLDNKENPSLDIQLTSLLCGCMVTPTLDNKENPSLDIQLTSLLCGCMVTPTLDNKENPSLDIQLTSLLCGCMVTPTLDNKENPSLDIQLTSLLCGCMVTPTLDNKENPSLDIQLTSLSLHDARAQRHLFSPGAATVGPSTTTDTLGYLSRTPTHCHTYGSAGSQQGVMPRRRRGSPTSSLDNHKPTKHARMTNTVGRGRKALESEGIFSAKKCIAWFHEYTGPDEDVIGPEGMEKFCEDIGVEPENIVMLSLAWKLGANQMGFFTLAEWLKGMTDLQCESVSKVRRKLDHLRSLLDDPVIFKNMYRYAYDFARERDQRSMDMDTAKTMLALLLGKHWSLFGSFHQFLEQSKYKVINRDQWCNVLEFSRLIHPDLNNYDEDGAWPVMLDEFVDWYRDQIGRPRTAGSDGATAH